MCITRPPHLINKFTFGFLVIYGNFFFWQEFTHAINSIGSTMTTLGGAGRFYVAGDGDGGGGGGDSVTGSVAFEGRHRIRYRSLARNVHFPLPHWDRDCTLALPSLPRRPRRDLEGHISKKERRPAVWSTDSGAPRPAAAAFRSPAAAVAWSGTPFIGDRVRETTGGSVELPGGENLLPYVLRQP